jgi:hypothetical protein
MDNASRALLIAGGILISIAVIGLATYLFASARGVIGESAKRLEIEQVLSFNRFYTGYPSTIRGIDAVNIKNKVVDNNNNQDRLGSIDGSQIVNVAPENYLTNYNLFISYDNTTGLVNRIIIN